MGGWHQGLAVWLIVAALLTMSVMAAEPIGQVVLARGDVSAVAADGSVRALTRRDPVLEGDTLTTGADGALQVRFDDGGMVSLRAESRLEVAGYRMGRPAAGPDRVLLRALQGAIRAVTGAIAREDPSAYEVETPVASIGIRGTHFEAAEEDVDSWVMGVWEGGIRVSNPQGALNLGHDAEFLFARTRAGEAPQGLVTAPDTLGESVAGGGPAGGMTGIDVIQAEAQPALRPDAGIRTDAHVPVAIGPGEGIDDLQTLLDLADRTIAEFFPLSAAERERLEAPHPSALLMGLLPDGSVVAGRGTIGDDGGVLVAFALPDGREALLRGGDAPVTAGADRVAGFDVTWGRFAAPRAGEGPILLIGADGAARAAVLSEDLTFAVVGDVRVADLDVSAAFRGETAVGHASSGEFTNFGVFFDAVVDLGEGRIRNGHLLLEVAGGDEEFRVNFEGAVRAGHAELDVTAGTISGPGGEHVEVDRGASAMQGLFTRDGDGFVGGFSIRELGNPDRFAEGAFIAAPVDE